MTWSRSDSLALVGNETRVSLSESNEALVETEGGEGGGFSNVSGDRWSTMAVTVLMTCHQNHECGINWIQLGTYLHETVC